jgi:hypothetical protein
MAWVCLVGLALLVLLNYRIGWRGDPPKGISHILDIGIGIMAAMLVQAVWDGWNARGEEKRLLVELSRSIQQLSMVVDEETRYRKTNDALKFPKPPANVHTSGMTVTFYGETQIFSPAVDLSISGSALSSGRFAEAIFERLLAYRVAMEDFLASHEAFENSGYKPKQRRIRQSQAVAALSIAKSLCELMTEDCAVEQ